MGWRELEALLPNLFVVSIVITLLASRLFSYLKNKQATSVVIKLLETNPDIEVETIKSIIQPPSHPLGDLRRGILLIVTGLACVIFALNMMDPEYKKALLGLSAFPGLVGLIYVMFHFLSKERLVDRLSLIHI